jgi:hypothetical protein
MAAEKALEKDVSYANKAAENAALHAEKDVCVVPNEHNEFVTCCCCNEETVLYRRLVNWKTERTSVANWVCAKCRKENNKPPVIVSCPGCTLYYAGITCKRCDMRNSGKVPGDTNWYAQKEYARLFAIQQKQLKKAP